MRGQSTRHQAELEEANRTNDLLNQEVSSLREQMSKLQEFKSSFAETQHQIQELQSQNASLLQDAERRKKEDEMRSQSGMTVDALSREIDSLTSENKNLQVWCSRKYIHSMSGRQYVVRFLDSPSPRTRKLRQREHVRESVSCSPTVSMCCAVVRCGGTQDDLLCEEWLHCSKYQEIWSKLSEYQTKYNDLLQHPYIIIQPQLHCIVQSAVI